MQKTNYQHENYTEIRKYYLPDAIEDLFYQLVKHLEKIIEANANRYTFVWKKVVAKNEKKMSVKIQASVNKINKFYKTNFRVEKLTIIDDSKWILKYLYKEKEAENIKFVQEPGEIKRYMYQKNS